MTKKRHLTRVVPMKMKTKDWAMETLAEAPAMFWMRNNKRMVTLESANHQSSEYIL
jgi:hypothetical protein